MTIETLYKEVREAIDHSFSKDEWMEDFPVAEFLRSVIENISDDTIRRCIQELVKAPNATDDELEAMIKRAESLEEAHSELEDKCPKCAGSGHRP
jgi:hypothetical protein